MRFKVHFPVISKFCRFFLFPPVLYDQGELVKQLSQKTTETLSKTTDAADDMYDNSRLLLNLQSSNLYLSHSEGSASWNELKPTAQQLLANVNQTQVNAYVSTDTISVRANTYTRTETDRNSRNRITVDDYDWKSLDELARDDNTIPRRYNAELYDPDGYMSDPLEKRRSPFHLDSLPDIIDAQENENDENSQSDKPKKAITKSDNDGIVIDLNPNKKKQKVNRDSAELNIANIDLNLNNTEDANLSRASSLAKASPQVHDINEHIEHADTDTNHDLLQVLDKKSNTNPSK
ncbi:hypothetical protein RFI_10943 [Reticulomyxa filosa]|uniref:Uncharacterized protein n=1 Tax=Reticulomyxa filosa TaxID=46433 RepID=X6NKC9_RETFI|nr:hypothetical protein RFI_10943 [Reticulomyxa filosa]|eukprot:ETO26194.1 hypothetical protein RFI_10943 [Reticulomyxa filosa]